MSLLYDALAYAEAGQPVFPCAPADIDNGDYVRRAKTPLTHSGHLAATSDPDAITRWWEKWPMAAIGLPTGVVYDVLDVDKKPGGVNGYGALNFLIGIGLIEDFAVKIVDTPSGGKHFYFPTSGDMGNATFARHGIDLRGIGGYVIAPPSIMFTPDGYEKGRYLLKGERPNDEGGPLDHERVRHHLRSPEDEKKRKPGGEPADARSLVHWLAQRGEGERNASLYWAACRLVESGEDPDVLLDVARQIGLTEHEAERTIASAKRGAA